MVRNCFILMNAIAGIICLLIFVFMQRHTHTPSIAETPLRYGTILLDTAQLGEITVNQDSIYVGNAKGDVCVLATLDGHAEMKTVPISKHAITAPILVHDGVCFVGDEDGNFYAYDLKMGLKWRYKTGNRIAGGATWAMGKVLVGSYDQKLYAFNPENGQIIYSVDCDSFINGTPILSNSGDTVFLGSCDGVIRKINVETGEVLGHIDLESPIPASPVLYDGMLYAVTHGGKLVAIDLQTFSERYSVDLPSSYTSSPCAFESLLFLTDDDGNITAYVRENGSRFSVLQVNEKMTPLSAGDATQFYAISKRGRLYQYQWLKGWNVKLLYDFQTDCQSSCQLIGQTIYFADESGGLYYFKVAQ